MEDEQPNFPWSCFISIWEVVSLAYHRLMTFIRALWLDAPLFEDFPDEGIMIVGPQHMLQQEPLEVTPCLR